MFRQLRARERSPPASDDGFFSLLPRCPSSKFDQVDLKNARILPREILLSILALLDVPSMVAISQCSTGFRDLTKDPFLYATVDLRQVPGSSFRKSHDDGDSDTMQWQS